MKKFRVFDISVDYDYRPNDDIYQDIVPAEFELEVEVPDNFNQLTFEEQRAILKDDVLEELSELVSFDTPDDPEFAISDVDFCFELEDN